MLHRLAHDAAGGKWLATGGGGYQWARVVPRAWTIYFAEMAGVVIPDELPESWLEIVRGEYRIWCPSSCPRSRCRTVAATTPWTRSSVRSSAPSSPATACGADGPRR